MTRFSFQTFSIKEGIQFKIRIDFFVQREIVTGLKYVQKTSRMGVTGKKEDFFPIQLRKTKLLCFLLQSIR